MVNAGGSRPRVALATSADWPNLAPDDAALAPALRRCGLEPEIALWTDGGRDWSRFDAVVIRSCWDYHDNLGRWLAWIDARGTERAGRLLHNPAGAVRWNARKTYLAELEARGVPVVPTVWIDASELAAAAPGATTRATTLAATLARHLEATGWDELVLKPAVSAGARHTHRLSRAALPAAEALLRAAVPAWVARGPLLVQPFAPEIAGAGASDGEWSLLFFAGRFSHAVQKRPASGDFRVQERHGGTTRAVEPTPDLLAVAERALAAAVPAAGLPDAAALLYARVDLVITAGGPLLIELELIEPALFLSQGPPGARESAGRGRRESPADTFAAALAAKVAAISPRR